MRSIKRAFGPYILEVRDVVEGRRYVGGFEFSCKLFVNKELACKVSAGVDGKMVFDRRYLKNENYDKMLLLVPDESLYNYQEAKSMSMSDSMFDKIRGIKCTIESVVKKMSEEFLDEKEREPKRKEFLRIHRDTCLCFEGRSGDFMSIRVSTRQMLISDMDEKQMYDLFGPKISEMADRGYRFINGEY